MARSYRKTPKIGYCRNKGEKSFKQGYNRRMRSKVNTMINTFHYEELDDIIFPEKHIEYSDVWDSRTDGPKMYFGDMKCNKQDRFSCYYDDDYDKYVNDCNLYYDRYMRK